MALNVKPALPLVSNAALTQFALPVILVMLGFKFLTVFALSDSMMMEHNALLVLLHVLIVRVLQFVLRVMPNQPGLLLLLAYALREHLMMALNAKLVQRLASIALLILPAHLVIPTSAI